MIDPVFFYFGLLLAVSSAFAYFFRKIGHSSIAGYLLAGAIFHSFITPDETFEFLSYLGAILLLFFVGLEFSIGKINTLGKRIFYVGFLDLLVNFSLGLALGFFFGFDFYEMLLLGGIVYISSSAVISKLLVDAQCMDRKETKTIIGVLIFEDLVMALLLASFSVLSTNPSIDLEVLAPAELKAILFCGFFVVFNKQITKALNILLSTESEEIFFLSVIGLLFLVSYAAAYLGLSEAIGAFFIGSALAETNQQKRIKKLVTPLAYFASTIFFLSFGLNVNLFNISWQLILMVSLLIVASMLGKMVTGMSTHYFRLLNVEEAQHVGWSLFPRGEFSILIASLFIIESGSEYNLTEIVAVYVFVLMILSTFLIKKYTRKCSIKAG